MENNKWVLAMYTIRSKQEYIFRTKKIREIVGASEAIKRSFDYFLKNNKICGKDTDFDSSRLDPDYDGYVLWEGGGNLCVLFRSAEKCIRHNRIFTRNLLSEYHGMMPLCALVETDDFSDYRNDYKKLMEQMEKRKKAMVPSTPDNMLPFVLFDRDNFQPYRERISIDGKAAEITAESYDKIKAYSGSEGVILSEKNLEELITEKGRESLLAVVHIDGNNMGSKISRILDGLSSYNECVAALRKNSAEIEDHYVKKGYKCIEDTLASLHPEENSAPWKRYIVGGGDDVTFICNARDALTVTEKYINAITDSSHSSTAGIAVFHSHFPFSEAYILAEETCDNAKKKAKKFCNENENYKNAEIACIDFQFLHGGADRNLEYIRKTQCYDTLSARPYVVKAYCKNEDITDKVTGLTGLSKFRGLGELLRDYARSAVKELGQTNAEGDGSYRFAYERIMSQNPGLRSAVEKTEPDFDKQRKLIFDIAEFCDIWFAKEKKGDKS